MVSPGINLKLGSVLFVVAFFVSSAALFGAAQLVAQERPGPVEEEEVPQGPANLRLVARNNLFDRRQLTVAAGFPVTLTLDNQDPVPHNFALYTNASATEMLFRSPLITGPLSETYTFNAPPPGDYFFRCDVHPDTMTGVFSSRQVQVP